MHLITRNVNTAFRELVWAFHNGELENGDRLPLVQKNSRNGGVTMLEEPCLITYTHPRERVLFNSARDANPFFHLYESLWMLAGRNDVAPLTYYVSKMKDFSDDDGKTFNGAYGYRWRHALRDSTLGWEDKDQLDIIVSHLKGNPESRRAVLQMWNVEDDLLKIERSKDVCCNLSVMFALRQTSTHESLQRLEYVLDMTVTNRSNDMIWGMLGANYVHFSVLQEYMAARLGVEVGYYYHFTNNLHVYDWNWKPEEWLMGEQPTGLYPQNQFDWETWYKNAETINLVYRPEVFEEEVKRFVESNKDNTEVPSAASWGEPFLRRVAQPVCNAFHTYRIGRSDSSLYWVEQIQSHDWKVVCANWLAKRLANHGI